MICGMVLHSWIGEPVAQSENGWIGIKKKHSKRLLSYINPNYSSLRRPFTSVGDGSSRNLVGVIVGYPSLRGNLRQETAFPEFSGGLDKIVSNIQWCYYHKVPRFSHA